MPGTVLRSGDTSAATALTFIESYDKLVCTELGFERMSG